MTIFRLPIEARRATKSRHCCKRIQQRAIPDAVIDLLLDFAEPCRAFGADRYAFSKRTWRKASAYIGPGARHFEEYRSVYIIVSNSGEIITAAYQH